MTPISMTYHHHVMENLLCEADTERRVRQSARTREVPRHSMIGSLLTVRAARQA